MWRSSGSLKGQNTLLAIFSLVIGAVIGEILDLDGAMNRAGNWVQKKVTHPGEEGAASTVAEGFVTASLLFGVGAMSIVGSLNSGLLGDHTMLFAKSLLDGVSSVVFSVSFGIGVPLSAIAVFVYEALITLAASVLASDVIPHDIPLQIEGWVTEIPRVLVVFAAVSERSGEGTCDGVDKVVVSPRGCCRLPQ